jgi:serine/threonine protein phosphatase PrpC
MNGFRDCMEDAHLVKLKIPSHNKSLFGVFDGHSGAGASQWCSQHICDYIDRLEEFTPENIINTLYKADAEFLKLTDINNHGSTCVMAIIDTPTETNGERDILVVNIGDSRCLIGKQNSEAYCMTTDHKPNLQEETDRITAAGGFVGNNRIDGMLSVSRSIGDSGFKANKDLSPENQKMRGGRRNANKRERTEELSQ